MRKYTLPPLQDLVCKHCGKPQQRRYPRKSGVVCNQCVNARWRFTLSKRIPEEAKVIEPYSEPQIKTRQCRDCGVTVQRKTYWRNPSCSDCSKKRAKKAGEERIKRQREEARRYRILLAVSPYGSYEELLEALKVRNPKTWAFHYDMTMEKRSHG